MIEEMTKKLKDRQDLTPKEAEKLYVEIKRRINRKDRRKESAALFGWFNAVYDLLKEGCRGRFITAVPSFREDVGCRTYITDIRSLLSPVERITLAYMFNIPVPNEEAGIKIEKTTEFTSVKCDRLGLLSRILKKPFCLGQGKMKKYISDLQRYGFSKDRTPLSMIGRPEDILDMKTEFLRNLGVPAVVVFEDCMHDDPEPAYRRNSDSFAVFAEDCALVRRVSALSVKDVIAMAEDMYESPVKSDVPDILSTGDIER